MTGLDKATAERLHEDLKVHNETDEPAYLLGYEDFPNPTDPYIMPVNIPQNYSRENSLVLLQSPTSN